MAKLKEKGFPEENIDTVLAEDIKFKGKLKFYASLMIKGNLEGEIEAKDGHLYVGEKAQVKANIEASSVSNMGKIEGNIKAKECLELFSEGSVSGDVSTSVIYIEKGALFNGKSKMNK
jgi:cytoskeletal protein CcmA (bactofilin family)